MELPGKIQSERWNEGTEKAFGSEYHMALLSLGDRTTRSSYPIGPENPERLGNGKDSNQHGGTPLYQTQ